MFKKGDLVVYVRPHPDEAGLVHRVVGTCLDGFGWWVKLAEEPEDSTGGPVEIEPGIYGGLGGWEKATEFKLAGCNQ
mgnify:FL=1